jgi:hypothetical protein
MRLAINAKENIVGVQHVEPIFYSINILENDNYREILKQVQDDYNILFQQHNFLRSHKSLCLHFNDINA